MNRQERDVLNTLLTEGFINQRMLAEFCGHSLGIVNRSVNSLRKEGYIDDEFHPTRKAMLEFQKKAPKNAIILAAGFGLRMVPINMETPKALLQIKGEILIERLIKQLQEAGINKIYVVVGFLKEQFEYLIDEYGVELIVNPNYISKNNMYSLKYALQYLSNSYILPCDIWCRKNPFKRNELYSWYMVSEVQDKESDVRINRKSELIKIPKSEMGNAMIGISYLLEEEAHFLKRRIMEFCEDKECDDFFWEEALYENGRMVTEAMLIPSSEVVEINTYEQLRDFDGDSSQLKSEAIEAIAEVFGIAETEISDITVLKKGMTNRSFLFACKGKKYIMRIPGEGTDKLINRRQEADTYRVIAGKGICDDPVYIDPDNGYKITLFLPAARTCDPLDESDLKKCMKKLKEFHDMKLKTAHKFDIFGQIDFYESLWGGRPSAYRDYQKTKWNVFSLKAFIDSHVEEKALTHIDAVPDNFLFYDRGDGEEVQLTDWEYAGIQDPHVDIAMFCVYAMYDRKQIDRLIHIYFKGDCRDEIRVKIYCYIAVCGLLWSNWCEYKRYHGVEFGEYSLRQYRFAKEYYRIAKEEIENLSI